MFKFIAMLGCTGVLAASALGLSLQGYYLPDDPFRFFRPLPEVDASFNDSFRKEFLDCCNHLRDKGSAGLLQSDGQIQDFVAAFLESDHAPESIELNTVFDSLQNQFPGAQYLAANLVSAVSREDLMSQLNSWEELTHPEFRELSTSVVKSGRRLVAMSVLSRRIPKFTIEGANETGGRFYNTCPHCGSSHALDLERKNKTLILSCPDCHLSYDVLAAGTGERLRRAVQFFTGFKVPDLALEEYESPKSKILAIWKRVADHCNYEHDAASFQDSEVWKTSEETWREEKGDCEDTSILLADALISAGFDARVAIGWNGNIGQHAWVVVNVEGQQYILESTLQENPCEEDIAPIAEGAYFYRPEQLFDRERLYFLKSPAEAAAKDCFSKEIWTGVHWD